jgi:2-polyprenyl-6-methoxyphenol hydroxylase-like FAD-dependent oxidoreductase
MKGARVSPYYNIEVWDGSGPGAIHFDNQGNPNAEELGYIIENRVIVAALNERLKQFPNVKIVNTMVKSVSQNDPNQNHDDFFNIVTSDEKSIKTRLLVPTNLISSFTKIRSAPMVRIRLFATR